MSLDRDSQVRSEAEGYFDGAKHDVRKRKGSDFGIQTSDIKRL